MRIVQIAPLYESTPPRLYGGTERVVAFLTDALVELSHDVTLFASADAAGEPPVGYPVACLPQAWSSGAIFMMLQACLGLQIDGWRREIHIDRPELPGEIERLTVRDVKIGDERVNLLFQRIGDRVAASPVGRVADAIRILVRG